MSQDSTPKEPFETSAPRSRGARLATWLRGAAFLVLLLALAGLLAWFLVIVPLQRQVTGLSADLAAAQGEIATLQASRPLQEVYSLLADANTARFELMRNRSSSASAALLSSEQTLASLRTQSANAMPPRWTMCRSAWSWSRQTLPRMTCQPP